MMDYWKSEFLQMQRITVFGKFSIASIQGIRYIFSSNIIFFLIPFSKKKKKLSKLAYLINYFYIHVAFKKILKKNIHYHFLTYHSCFYNLLFLSISLFLLLFVQRVTYVFFFNYIHFCVYKQISNIIAMCKFYIC